MRCAGADLDHLLVAADLTGRSGRAVRNAGEDVRMALFRFTSTSRHFVPDLPAMGHRIAELADGIDHLRADIEATGTRLADADRWAIARVPLVGPLVHDPFGRFQWQDAHGVVGNGLLTVDLVRWSLDARRAGPGGGVWRDGVAWLRDEAGLIRRGGAAGAVGAGGRLVAGGGPAVALGHLADDLRGAVHPGAVVDEVLDRAVDGAGDAFARAEAAFRGPRVGSVVRAGGAAFGVVGMGLAAADVVSGLRDGDMGRAALGAASLVADVAMTSGFPPAVLAGAVLTAGVLVHEHREAIADGIGRLADGAERLLRGLF